MRQSTLLWRIASSAIIGATVSAIAGSAMMVAAIWLFVELANPPVNYRSLLTDAAPLGLQIGGGVGLLFGAVSGLRSPPK